MAFRLPHLSKGGIVFYDPVHFSVIAKVTLDESMSYGDVFVLKVKGVEENVLFRLFDDNREFVDEYSPIYVDSKCYGDLVDRASVYSRIGGTKTLKGFEKDTNPLIPYEDSVFYLAHVRGLTMADSRVKSRGTFKGIEEKITYLKDLGITGLVLMPCYEFLEREKINDLNPKVLDYTKDPNELPPVNYWGFKEGFYFSLKANYAISSDADTEFKELICKLHKNNMELIMMMYFPDNIDRALINEVLRFYVTVYHVDGFRIVGTNIDTTPIIEDPFLKNTKLLLEDDNLNRYYTDKPVKFKNLCHVSPYFNDVTRSLLKGDEDRIGSYSFLFRENNKLYQPLRYISDYYGFTLNDLVSFNVKHNEANGDRNQDGNNYNFSYNWGVEGKTRKTGINKTRQKMIKNALMLVLLTQGTPMLRAGDEWLNTAEGNNNPWNQDNETGWTVCNRNKAGKEIYDFTKNLLAFRKKHCVLHTNKELRMLDYMSTKLPDISFHSDNAFTMNQDPYSREFAVLYSGDYAKIYKGKAEPSVYIVINMHWEDRDFSIPVNPKEYNVGFLYCTDGTGDEGLNEENAKVFKENTYHAPGRTVSIFIIDRKKQD